MANPTCFLSYSWESESHKDWVRRLGTDLMRHGVNVRLDQWDARPGIDLGHFMEHNIRSADFVLLICTPDFANKANKTVGGVGYEKAIITGELFQNTPDQGKYVPLLRSGEIVIALPSYLASKLYIDFRDDKYFEGAFETLLRHIFDSPKHPKPPIGSLPDFNRERVFEKKTKYESNPNLPSFTSENISLYSGLGRWDWTVYLVGNESDVDEVDYAEYTLHETFPNSVRVVRDRGGGRKAFPLSSNGWGIFRIFIRIFLRDGRIISLSHDLTFD